MRPPALLHFYRVRLRSRLGAELLAVTGIAVGVALLFAALIANASLTGGVRELSRGIVGKADFQVSARAAAGFDSRVLRLLERVPGATAVPVAEARVNLVGPRGSRSVLLVGADPRSGAFGGALLQAAKDAARSGRRGLVLPAPSARRLGLRSGERLRVEAGGGTSSTRVAAEPGGDELGALADAPVALAPLRLVQALAGMRGRLSRVFVTAAPGRRRAVKASLRRIANGRLNLAPADHELALFERAAYPTSASTALFSLLSGLVGFLFALNATLLTVPQRRRLLAALRIAGYAPAAMIQVLLFDALLLGLAGTVTGLLLGDLASRMLFATPPEYLSSAFAIGSHRIVTAQSAARAGAAGVLAACLSVLLPVWDFRGRSRTAPAPWRSPAVARRLFYATGAVLLALSVAIAARAPSLSLVSLGALLLALLLLLQPWLRLAAAGFKAGCRRLRSPVAILAALELRAGSARIRTLALAATGAVAVFATVSIGGARADLQRGLDAVAADLDRGAQVWVGFRGPTNIFATSPIEVSPERMQAIERLPGVREVTRNRGSFLDVGRSRAWVLAPAPSRVAAVLRNDVSAGSVALAARRLRRGDRVTLSEGLASELKVGVGDLVDLPLPLPTRLRVAALTDNFGWPGGALVLSAATYGRAWGSTDASLLAIRVGHGAGPADVAAAVRRVLGARSALLVETSSQRVRRQRATSRAGLSRLSQISFLVLAASLLAMATSMAGLVWQRRPAFAALKVHGLSQGQLWRALLLEAALLLGAGCVAGVGFGLIGQLLLDRALQAITGFPVMYETASPVAWRALVSVTAGALAALALPGWLAVRIRPRAGPAE